MHPIDNKSSDDEISLSEILSILNRNWQMIALLTVLSGVLAGILAFVLPQKFEASIYLEAPLAAQYMEINEGRTPVSGLDWVAGVDLYGFFLNQLTSEAAKHEFFEKTYLPSLQDQPATELEKNTLYATVINKLVVVQEPVPKKGRQLYSVQIQAPSGEKAVAWTKEFLTQVETAARGRWVEGESRLIAAIIKNTEKNLAEKYTLAKNLREDREIRLGEALKVAKAVGQQTPQLTMGQLPKQDSVTAFADGSGMYARGTKSLGAEIEVLRTRQDEAAFIDGLRESEAKLKALQEQDFSGKHIGMYRIDGQLLQPAKPVSPKKGLMVVAGLFIGLFAGLAFAFARHAIVGKKATS